MNFGTRVYREPDEKEKDADETALRAKRPLDRCVGVCEPFDAPTAQLTLLTHTNAIRKTTHTVSQNETIEPGKKSQNNAIQYLQRHAGGRARCAARRRAARVSGRARRAPRRCARHAAQIARQAHC